VPTFDSELHLEAIAAALVHLARAITIDSTARSASHTPLAVKGLEDAPTINALATYLVGCIAGAVDFDARLSPAGIISGEKAATELKKQVIDLIGADNNWPTEKAKKMRDTRRNAWIAEGIAHAMLVVRRIQETPLLSGELLALSLLHTIPSAPGLDSVGVYLEGDLPVVVIGESKASRENGSGELSNAASHFAKIDASVYGPDLRSHLLALRRVVPDKHREQVSGSLWEEHRTYVPFITHEKELLIANPRPALGNLEPSIERKRVVSIRLSEFHMFFDQVSDAMREISGVSRTHV
jgi:hypothetical protein